MKILVPPHFICSGDGTWLFYLFAIALKQGKKVFRICRAPLQRPQRLEILQFFKNSLILAYKINAFIKFNAYKTWYRNYLC